MRHRGPGTPTAASPPGRARPDLAFVLLAGVLVLEAGGVGMLFPLLARIQAAHHLSTASLGLLSGGYFLAALVAQLGISRFLDGRRARGVLLAGLVLGVGALVWFALAGDLLQLVAARALGGAGYGIVGPAALRAATVGIPVEQRGARLGRLTGAQMTGIVLGPLAGTVLASGGSLSLPFLTLAGLLGLATLALALRSPPPVADGEDLRSSARSGRLPRPPLRPIVALLCLAVAAQLANGLYDSLWSRLLTDRGAGSLLIGVSLTLFGIPFVLLAPAGGRVAGRRGPLLAAAVALVVADGFMASYGFVTSPVAITILGCFEACAQAVAVPGGYAAVSTVWPDSRAATGQGWYAGAGTAAAGTAALIGAPVYGWAGPGVVFGGGAVVSVVFVALALVAARTGPGHRPVSADPVAGRVNAGRGRTP